MAEHRPRRRSAPGPALVHELTERLTAAGIYLAAARHMAAAPPDCAADRPSLREILDKAQAQLDRASRLVHRLRQAEAGTADEPATSRQPVAETPPAPPSYRVRFLNHFARGSTSATACQREIVIRSAKTREEAIEAAKKRFSRLEGIPHWHIHAGMIDVEEIAEDDRGPSPDPAAEPEE